MRKGATIGIGLGALLTAMSVSGNLQRGDVHLVSTFPSVLPLILFVLIVFAVTRRHARSELYGA